MAHLAVTLLYGEQLKRAAAKYDYSSRLMRWMDNLKHDNQPMQAHELPHAATLMAQETLK